jgi:L-fuconolactonase
MKTIDSHQHFWTYDPQRHQWITDDMNTIRRDYLPAQLADILKENEVDGCVVVQEAQTEAETNKLIAFCKEHSFIKGVVGWVDLQSTGIDERLAYFQQFSALKGLRHILQGEKQRYLFLQPPFLHGLSLLEQYHLSYDLLILPDQLRYVPELLEKFPNQRFVIDHLAKPMINSGEIADWKKDMQKIAGYDNVYCKVSGMVTEARRGEWKASDFNPYLDVVTEAFGLKRLMYGSDWPVCLVAADYTTVINLVRSYFSAFSRSEQEQVFARTATEFYQLDVREQTLL